MTTSEMLAELREVLADEVRPYAVRDTTLLGYLSEGQAKFCEDTGFFTDSSTFTIDTEVGKSSYVLDPRIIRVEDVFIGERQLCKSTRRHAAATAPEPVTWRTDQNSRALTVWPTPLTVVKMELSAWRYPLAPISKTVPPELPLRLQRACIEWAAAKHYSHHDVEIQDTTAAAKHKSNYRQYVLEGRAAKRNLDSEEIVVGVNACYQAGC